MSEQQHQQLMAEIKRQNEILARLCQVVESILIVMADDLDNDASNDSPTYLSGKPKQ
jgi:hypothetical protein